MLLPGLRIRLSGSNTVSVFSRRKDPDPGFFPRRLDSNLVFIQDRIRILVDLQDILLIKNQTFHSIFIGQSYNRYTNNSIIMSKERVNFVTSKLGRIRFELEGRIWIRFFLEVRIWIRGKSTRIRNVAAQFLYYHFQLCFFIV